MNLHDRLETLWMEGKRDNMKILHIWDIAGFGQRITDYINSNDYGESRVIKVKGTPVRFTLLVIKELLFYRPDIVHVHYWTKGIILAKLFTRSKIIMHFHGSDIRGKSIPWHVNKWADRIIVSTRDLLMYGDYYGYPV